MPQDLTFTIALPAEVGPDDQEALRLAVQAVGATVQEAESKDVLSIAALFVVVMGGVGTVVGTINGTIELAEKISAWRRDRAARGARGFGTLQRPGQPPLDLDPTRTSDPALLAWLQQAHDG